MRGLCQAMGALFPDYCCTLVLLFHLRRRGSALTPDLRYALLLTGLSAFPLPCPSGPGGSQG
jgi:hypothetical protein